MFNIDEQTRKKRQRRILQDVVVFFYCTEVPLWAMDMHESDEAFQQAAAAARREAARLVLQGGICYEQDNGTVSDAGALEPALQHRARDDEHADAHGAFAADERLPRPLDRHLRPQRQGHRARGEHPRALREHGPHRESVLLASGRHPAGIQPGDLFLNNSPYHGNTHHADYTYIAPVFNEGS